MKARLRELKRIDWDFSDYKGASSSSANINSLHWYLAPFVAPIPAILIQTLTQQGDTVLDPFAGAGVALVEAARLDRNFIGIDVNPYAVNIMRAKVHALEAADDQWFSNISENVDALSSKPVVHSVIDYCARAEINTEVFRWFERKTLRQLCNLHYYVVSESDSKDRLLKKVLFSSILQRSCSQQRVYTYVTDGCFPEKMVHVDAMRLFRRRAQLTALAAQTFRKQYKLLHGVECTTPSVLLSEGDARNLAFLRDNSVDMVITSPPYLGVHDYVRSMRLTALFFPERNGALAMRNEIGARWKRNRRNAYDEYLAHMGKAFSEICRVLRPRGFVCLVIGRGGGKTYKGDTVHELITPLHTLHRFKTALRVTRTIRFRRIPPGFQSRRRQTEGKEEIIILNRD